MLSGHLAGATALMQERQYASQHQHRPQYQHQRARSYAHAPQAQVQSPILLPRRTLRRSDASISESPRGSSRIGGGGGSMGEGGGGGGGMMQQAQPTAHQVPKSPTIVHMPMSPAPPPENARKVSGKRGHLELVEQRVLEDSPARTISLWRERVAQSSVNGDLVDGATGTNNPDAQSEANSHARVYVNRRRGSDAVQGLDRGHRRMPSGSHHLDPRIRRVVSEQAGHGSSLGGSGTRNGSVRDSEVRAGKHNRATYERSEVSVTSKIVALVYG